MRVLFVNENIGGHATVHLHLERALGAHPEIEPEFLHVPPPGLGRRLVGARIPPLDRFDADLKPLRAELALSMHVRRRLAAALARCDVAHVYTHNAALLSARALESVPTVVSLDTTNAQNAFLLPYRRPTGWTRRLLPMTMRLEQRVYDAATLVVANSEWAAGSLRRDYGVPPEKIRIVPFGIAMPEPPAEAPAREGLPRIVFVGRSLERKGGNRLLRLHQEHLRDRCRLVMVTPESVAAGLEVEVIGDVRPGDGRVLQVLHASDVFVFPSEIDMWPNAVLEAMGAGLPVVALNVNAMAEMVPPEAGILVEPGDDDALVAAIRRLIDNPGEAARMGAEARRVALERHDVSGSTSRLVEALHEAVRIHAVEP